MQEWNRMHSDDESHLQAEPQVIVPHRVDLTLQTPAFDQVAVPPDMKPGTAMEDPHSPKSPQRVRDIMTAQLITISPSDSAQSAARLMADSCVGALPVEVSGMGTLVGIVTDRDIVTAVLAKGLPTSTAVYEFMTLAPYECDEDDDVADAARKMADLGVRRLVVRDPQRHVVGIVSLNDVPRSIAGGQAHHG